MRADVRIRIRGDVIRVRIGEACIRTVIRGTAEQDTTGATNLLSIFIFFTFVLLSIRKRYRLRAMRFAV